ncbi:MAG: hypothetical protein ABSA84_01850 [Gammaproteobacteria bacterium]|jgi:hypothetical protein
MFKKILYTQCTQPKEPIKERSFYVSGVGVELITLSWMEQQKQRFTKEIQQIHEQKIKKLPKPLSAVDLIVDEITPAQKLKQKTIQENINNYARTGVCAREHETSSKSSNAISDSDSDHTTDTHTINSHPTWCYQFPRPVA